MCIVIRVIITRQGEEEAQWLGYSLAEGIFIPCEDLWYGVLKGCFCKIFIWKVTTSYYCQM
jgi:hypothetical protein